MIYKPGELGGPGPLGGGDFAPKTKQIKLAFLISDCLFFQLHVLNRSYSKYGHSKIQQFIFKYVNKATGFDLQIHYQAILNHIFIGT